MGSGLGVFQQMLMENTCHQSLYRYLYNMQAWKEALPQTTVQGRQLECGDYSNLQLLKLWAVAHYSGTELHPGISKELSGVQGFWMYNDEKLTQVQTCNEFEVSFTSSKSEVCLVAYTHVAPLNSAAALVWLGHFALLMPSCHKINVACSTSAHI